MNVDAEGNEIGKLFVGGLDQSTTNDSLKCYFSQFGEVEEALVMMDNRTNRSRGFGYIKYKDPGAVSLVMDVKTHVLDNKTIDPKLCNINMKGKNRRKLKIFVGGIAVDHNEEILKNFFSQYGKVTDVNLLSFPNRPRHRGFAFVGFEDAEVTKKLIDMHFLNIEGKQVEIKAMEPQTGTRSLFPPSSALTTNRYYNNIRQIRPPKFNTSDFYQQGWNHQWNGGNGFQNGGIWNSASQGHCWPDSQVVDHRTASAWSNDTQHNGWSSNPSAIWNSRLIHQSNSLQTNWSPLCQALSQVTSRAQGGNSWDNGNHHHSQQTGASSNGISSQHAIAALAALALSKSASSNSQANHHHHSAPWGSNPISLNASHGNANDAFLGGTSLSG